MTSDLCRMARIAGAAACIVAMLTACQGEKPVTSQPQPTRGSGIAADAQPQPLAELQAIRPTGIAPDQGQQIRISALRDAARSYGMRGGLAHKTWEIRQTLVRQEASLDKLFNFTAVLTPTTGGVQIVPPVVGRADNALKIAENGQVAGMTDRVLRIIRNARLTTTAPNWRAYLVRDWAAPEPPAEILRPRDDDEIARWAQWVAEGWKVGEEQAQAIFESDMDRLLRDWEGMIRFRELEAQNLINPPVVVASEPQVAGDANLLKVGDQNVRITSPATLNVDASRWQPQIKAP